MELIKLIYVSTVSDAFSLSSVDEILVAAQRNNGENGITGILYFNHKYFMQYLEGDKQEVESTYKRILEDNRHYNVLLLDKSALDERQFGCWSMAYILQSEILQPLNLYFMDSPDFNPYRLDTQSANEIIIELKSYLPLAHLHSGALSKAYR
ncbi:BLUF domain-containing protein [Vibrio tubiashii]|uniref:BLUF domain-containing protein n=1 Tax=Vibrio tubiashii TaxID=29498 RepID=A0AAE5GMZ6_9VIBR|nr:BLUF domain-containing protein [Vibrio tubiashii]NOI79761.1 BLUF domain-containing protein [Vibrio tubiashii]